MFRGTRSTTVETHVVAWLVLPGESLGIPGVGESLQEQIPVAAKRRTTTLFIGRPCRRSPTLPARNARKQTSLRRQMQHLSPRRRLSPPAPAPAFSSALLPHPSPRPRTRHVGAPPHVLVASGLRAAFAIERASLGRAVDATVGGTKRRMGDPLPRLRMDAIRMPRRASCAEPSPNKRLLYSPHP